MKGTLILFFLIFFVSSTLLAQIGKDTLNKVNAKGKKIGFWVEYLNDYLISTPDSSTAYYYAYNYYENGKLIIWTSAAQYYKKKALYVVSDSQKPVKGNPVLLNGNFKFYYKDSLGLDETYKDGLPVYTATCAPDPNGNPVKTEIIDYTKQYNGQF